MHQYSIDTKERPLITALLAIFSIAIVLILQKLLALVELDYWWISAPSTMSIFWLTYMIFGNYLWKIRILKRLLLVRTPDISGMWKGRIYTTHDELKQPIEAKLRIIQTWTTIEFALETGQSSSKSNYAYLCFAHPKDVKINYQYMNSPKIGAQKTMNIHYGSASMELSSDRQKLNGEYYSGRGRGTQGTMEFERI